MHQPKVILIVLDGWGYNSAKKGNVITEKTTPYFFNLWENYPHTLLEASSGAVGLPWGETGSSEVGHLCIGSGRIIFQDLSRITNAVKSGEFKQNKVLSEAADHAQKNNSALHLITLVSVGGVHSHLDHLFATLELLKETNFKEPSFIHMFTDGRDTPPKEALIYVQKVKDKIKELGLKTKISTVTGRFFAMDRDHRWERTFAAYDCMTAGKGEKAASAEDAITKAYNRSETDEFIQPTNITDEAGKPLGLIKDNDALIFLPFRPERMRQLTEAFLLGRPEFRRPKLKNQYVVTLTEYAKYLPSHVAFLPEKINNPLAKILSQNNYSQLHIAETEKYAHVTYFFNGFDTTPNKQEKWAVVPSPHVATYDRKPEMSAKKITARLLESLSKEMFDFVLINFANADMVGHTGKIRAAQKAVQTVDKQLETIIKKLPETTFIITADHGNAEEMVNPDSGGIHTSHTSNPVPFILVSPEYKNDYKQTQSKVTGILADIAPTILHFFKIKPSKEMTGCDLVSSLFEPSIARPQKN